MAALFINASTAAWSFACKLGVTMSHAKPQTFSIDPNTRTDFALIDVQRPNIGSIHKLQQELLSFYVYMLIAHHSSP